MIFWPIFLDGGGSASGNGQKPAASGGNQSGGNGQKPTAGGGNSATSKGQKPAAGGGGAGSKPSPKNKIDYGSPLTIISRSAMRELARRYGWLDVGIDRIQFRESGDGYEAIWMPYKAKPDGSYEATNAPVKIVWSQDPSGEWRISYSFTTIQDNKPVDHTGGGFVHGLRRQQDGRVAYMDGNKPVTVEEIRKRGMRPEDYILENVRNYLSGFSHQSQQRDQQPSQSADQQQPLFFTGAGQQSGQQNGQQSDSQGGQSNQQPQAGATPTTQQPQAEKGSIWDEMVRQMIQMMPMLMMMRMMMGGGGQSQTRNDGFPARYVIL